MYFSPKLVIKMHTHNSIMIFCRCHQGVELSGTCGGTYDDSTSSSYTIRSPNYPKNYDNRADCSWLITALKETTFVLTFMEFETEKRYDYLFIYNGSNDEGIQLEKLSGNSIPSSIRFTGRTMYLKFRSDSQFNKKGFKLLLLSGEYVEQIFFRIINFCFKMNQSMYISCQI